MRLLKQRAERAEAAETRLKMPTAGGLRSGLTPLGEAIVVARRVDEVEASLRELEVSLRRSPGAGLAPAAEKEQARITEVLMQCQLALDSVQGDESVRPMRRVQTMRIQGLLQAAERLTT